MDTFATKSQRWAGVALALMLATFTNGQQWITERISVDSNGVQGLGSSIGGWVSRDYRFVTFESTSDLVLGDTNGVADIFVKDRVTGVTTRVSTSSTESQGNQASVGPTLSADGRYVAFVAHASNLVVGDTNGLSDVFVKDRLTGITTRVSVSSSGAQGTGVCIGANISPNGRYVAFESNSINLVAGAGGWTMSSFVHDRQTGLTTCISRSSAGVLANSWSGTPNFSFDGRYVAFSSDASNLVPNDTNGKRDIFVHDQDTGMTKRVSVSTTGAQGNFPSDGPFINDDGTLISFESNATNLVSGDTNFRLDGFVHNALTGTTTRISISSSGVEGNGDSWGSQVRGGRFVLFCSTSSNLDARDPDVIPDVYMHDCFTGKTALVSVSTAGVKGNATSFPSCISDDGTVVVFFSEADNLVVGDTNRYFDVFLAVLKNFEFSLTLN